MSDQSFRVMVAHFLHFVRGMSFKTTLKNWMLPIAMVGGASLYLIYYTTKRPDEIIQRHNTDSCDLYSCIMCIG